MKWNRIAVLVFALIAAPQAPAEGPFAGISFGQVSIDDADTGNPGFVAGHSPAEGFGFEVFYLKGVSDDSASSSGFTGDVTLDTWGIFAVYKTGGEFYFKGKFGYGVVSMEADIDNGDDFRDSESDFAFGVAAGTRLGPGDLELAYTIIPVSGDFDDTDINADTDIIAVNYLWYF